MMLVRVSVTVAVLVRLMPIGGGMLMMGMPVGNARFSRSMHMLMPSHDRQVEQVQRHRKERDQAVIAEKHRLGLGPWSPVVDFEDRPPSRQYN